MVSHHYIHTYLNAKCFNTGAVLELSFIPSVPDTGEHATAVDDIHGTTSSSPKTMGFITFKIRRLPNTRGQIEESALALASQC